MKLNPIEDRLSANPGTAEDVILTLRQLLESIKKDPESWENPTLDRYLEAMLAWLEAMKPRVEDKVCWRLFAEMLESAKVYE